MCNGNDQGAGGYCLHMMSALAPARKLDTRRRQLNLWNAHTRAGIVELHAFRCSHLMWSVLIPDGISLVLCKVNRPTSSSPRSFFRKPSSGTRCSFGAFPQPAQLHTNAAHHAAWRRATLRRAAPRGRRRWLSRAQARAQARASAQASARAQASAHTYFGTPMRAIRTH